jgi:deazaflavin-dependent oxidoreductase (nitroreductase family)
MDFKQFTRNRVAALHRGAFQLSRGRLFNEIDGMPVVRLTTTGRKSGKPRVVMLTSPLRHEGDLVLVASKGGAAEHPGWFHNLVADPQVSVTAVGATARMTARVATHEERAELWPKVVAAAGVYKMYQRRTSRELPLVILER